MKFFISSKARKEPGAALKLMLKKAKTSKNTTNTAALFEPLRKIRSSVNPLLKQQQSCREEGLLKQKRVFLLLERVVDALIQQNTILLWMAK